MFSSQPAGARLSWTSHLARLAGRLMLLAFCLMALVIICVAGSYLYSNTVPRVWWVLYAGLPVLLLAAAAWLLPEGHPRTGLFLAALFVAALALKGAMALLVPTQPDSDFLLLYDAAQELARGANPLNDMLYFQRWPYQSAFVAWLALFIRLFHANVRFFQLMNVLFSALTNLLVYAMARRFASERGARVAALLFLLYPGTFFLIPVLSNQHLSEFLLLLSLYVFTTPAALPRRILLAGAAGALLTLSNAIRPMAAVVLLAVLAYGVLQFLDWLPRRDGSLWARLIPCGVFLVCYLLFARALDAAVRLSGLNVLGLTNQAPEWKLILGLNTQTGGQYSDADAAAVFGADVPDQTAALQALLQERLASLTPASFLGLVKEKIFTMWGRFEDSSWAFTPSVLEHFDQMGVAGAVMWAVDKLRRLGSGCYMGIGLLCTLGSLSRFRRLRRLQGPETLLMLTALAYFCAHLFLEIQSRYRSTMTLLLIVVAAAGVDTLHAWLPRHKGPAA